MLHSRAMSQMKMVDLALVQRDLRGKLRKMFLKRMVAEMGQAHP